jgi:transposase
MGRPPTIPPEKKIRIVFAILAGEMSIAEAVRRERFPSSRFQLLRPFLVGLGQSPHLVGGQAKITEHCPERQAIVDRVEKLFPQLDG